jgi:tetratricopeptide (TPR) repeat protein
MNALSVKTSQGISLAVALLIFLLLRCAAHPPAHTAGANTAAVGPTNNADPSHPALIEGVNAAAIDPIHNTDPNMCYSLGVYYYSQGELNAAIKKLKKDIKQQPQHGESHALLGLIYEKKGEPKKAEQEFDAAAKTLPTISKYCCQIAVFYKQMGMTHLLQNNLDQAVNCLQKSMTFFPQDEDTKQLLAFGYCRMADRYTTSNQNPLAAEYYQKARTLYPALPQQRVPADISVWPAWVRDNFSTDK